MKKKNVLYLGLGLTSLFSVATSFGILSSCSSIEKNNSNSDDFIDDDMMWDQNFEEWIKNEIKLEIQHLDNQLQQGIETKFNQIINDLDNLKKPEAIKHFNLESVQSNSPTTNYIVGDKVTIQPNFGSSKTNKNDETNYKYYWFIDYSKNKKSRNKAEDNQNNKINDQIAFLRVTNEPQVDLYDLAKYDDNAKLTCVQINTSNPYQQFKENNFKNIDAKYWQTQLVLGMPFTISNPTFKLNNGAITSVDDNSTITYLTTQSQEFEIQANCEVNEKYKNYLRYQWFKKDISGIGEFQKIEGATNQILQGSIDVNDAGIYKCVMYLQHDAQIPGGNDNTYVEYSNGIQTAEFKVNVVESTEFNDEKTKYDVEIQGKDLKESKNDSLALVQANDTFTVKPHIYLGSVDLNNRNSNNKEVDQIRDVNFKWRKANQSTKNDEELRYSTGVNGELIFKNIQKEDAGGYVCDVNVSFNNGGNLSYTTNELDIPVGEPGKITLRVENNGKFNLFNGDSHTFKVEAKIPNYNDDTNEKIKIVWMWKTKEGNWEEDNKVESKELSLNQTQVYALKNYDLKVVASYENDKAKENEADINPGSVERLLEVNIVDPEIRFSETQKELNDLVLGKNVTLSVSTTVLPSQGTQISSKWKPKYQWYKKNTSSKSSEWQEVSGQTKPNYTINVDTIDLDNTKYACKVTLEGVYDSSMLEKGYGEFSLNTRDINNSSITHHNVDDFVNHFNQNNINNNSVSYDDVLEDVSKYLGANKSEIELVELKNSELTSRFFNSNQTKDIVITLKQSANSSWSTSLGKSKKYSTTVTNSGKTLTIQNVSTSIKNFKTNLEVNNFSSIQENVDKTKRLETLEHNLSNQKNSIIKKILEHNSVDSKYFDLDKSTIELKDYQSKNNESIKRKIIVLKIKLKDSFLNKSDQNVFDHSINYDYKVIDLTSENQTSFKSFFKKNISDLAKIVLGNENLNKFNDMESGQEIDLGFSQKIKYRELNPLHDVTNLSNPMNTVLELAFMENNNVSFEDNKLKEVNEFILKNDTNSLKSMYTKKNVKFNFLNQYTSKIANFNWDDSVGEFKLQLATNKLKININNLTNFKEEVQKFQKNDLIQNPHFLIQLLDIFSTIYYPNQDGEEQINKWIESDNSSNGDKKIFNFLGGVIKIIFENNSIKIAFSKNQFRIDDSIKNCKVENIVFNERETFTIDERPLNYSTITLENLVYGNTRLEVFDDEESSWNESLGYSFETTKVSLEDMKTSRENVVKKWEKDGKLNNSNFENIVTSRNKENELEQEKYSTLMILKNPEMISELLNALKINPNRVAGIYLAKGLTVNEESKYEIQIIMKFGYSLFNPEGWRTKDDKVKLRASEWRLSNQYGYKVKENNELDDEEFSSLLKKHYPNGNNGKNKKIFSLIEIIE